MRRLGVTPESTEWLSQRSRGLLDTSVVIDLQRRDAQSLPAEIAVSSVTLAELAAGPRATNDAAERARRQERLQRVEATVDSLPFDAGAAGAYGRIYAATVAAGRKAQGEQMAQAIL